MVRAADRKESEELIIRRIARRLDRYLTEMERSVAARYSDTEEKTAIVSYASKTKSITEIQDNEPQQTWLEIEGDTSDHPNQSLVDQHLLTHDPDGQTIRFPANPQTNSEIDQTASRLPAPLLREEPVPTVKPPPPPPAPPIAVAKPASESKKTLPPPPPPPPPMAVAIPTSESKKTLPPPPPPPPPRVVEKSAAEVKQPTLPPTPPPPPPAPPAMEKPAAAPKPPAPPAMEKPAAPPKPPAPPAMEKPAAPPKPPAQSIPHLNAPTASGVPNDFEALLQSKTKPVLGSGMKNEHLLMMLVILAVLFLAVYLLYGSGYTF